MVLVTMAAWARASISELDPQIGALKHQIVVVVIDIDIHGDHPVAGCAVLEAVCQTWPAARMRVADRGVREGILCDMTGGPRRSRLDAAE